MGRFNRAGRRELHESIAGGMRLRVVGAVDNAFHDRRDYKEAPRRALSHGKTSPVSRGDMGPAGCRHSCQCRESLSVPPGDCSIMPAVCLVALQARRSHMCRGIRTVTMLTHLFFLNYSDL
jgi:hypothetical protein